MSRHLLQTHTCDSPLNIALILISRYCRHSTTFATESGGLFYNISSLILSTSLPTSNTSSVPRHAATTTTIKAFPPPSGSIIQIKPCHYVHSWTKCSTSPFRFKSFEINIFLIKVHWISLVKVFKNGQTPLIKSWMHHWHLSGAT